MGAREGTESVMLRREGNLVGYTIGAADGDLGAVTNCLFDDAVWVVRFFVVDLGSSLPQKEVVLPPSAVERVDDEGMRLVVARTKDEVRRSPGASVHEPVSKQREAKRLDAGAGGEAADAHLRGDGFYASVAASRALDGAREARRHGVGLPGDPHLRSCREVAGYQVRGMDEEIGCVTGFVLDDANWAIRYLVVGLAAEEPSALRLLAPLRTPRVSWLARCVFANLPARAVCAAPAYDPAAALTPEFESRVHGHYDTPGAWANSADTFKVRKTD